MGLLLSGKNPAAYKTAERSTFTATAGQTTFTVPVGYNVGDIDVFLNGLKLVDGDDFIATNGSTVVLTSGANVGDSLSVVCYYNFLNSSSYTKAESDNKYLQPNGVLPMTSYLRTPNYGVSSTSDSLSASLEASAFAGEQGVGIKAFGRSIATTGGDILYTTDSRGAGNRHRFGYWNGTSFNPTLTIDNSGRVTIPFQPAFQAYGTSGNTAYSSGAEFIPQATAMNRGNCYNTTTGRFTAPVAGLYQFSYGVYSYTACQICIKKNGADYAPSDTAGIVSFAANEAKGGAISLALNANDSVSYGFRTSYAGNVYMSHAWFSGSLVC